MPIGEIIYDFFDALKARTKGYASLDYELEGYEKSDLVKVDLLLNGDQVDALSFIVHREKAYGRARRICEKLKENIPRQLFDFFSCFKQIIKRNSCVCFTCWSGNNSVFV